MTDLITKAVYGEINSSIVRSVDIFVWSGKSYVKLTGTKNPVVVGSTTDRKGYYIASNITYEKIKVIFNSMINTVELELVVDPTFPKVIFYSTLPNAQEFKISNFYVTGHLKPVSIVLTRQKQFITAESLLKHLDEHGSAKIIPELLVDKTGEPSIRIEKGLSKYATSQTIYQSPEDMEL